MQIFTFETNYLLSSRTEKIALMFGVRAPFCVSVFDVCEKCFNFIRILFCVTISAERKPSRCMSRCQRDNDEIEMEKNGEKPTKTYKITAIVNVYEIKIPTQYTFAFLLPFSSASFFFLLFLFPSSSSSFRSKFSWSYSVCGACACAWCVRIYCILSPFPFFLGKASVNDYMAARVKRKYLLQM